MSTLPPFEEALAPDSGPPADDLAGRVTAGASWITAANAVSYTVQFLSTIVLVRLLDPEDYGLTAIVWVVTAFALLFTELGIGQAIVHRRDLDEDFASAGFWVSFLSGVSLTLILCALAPVIAWIYGEPDLVGLVMLASLAFTLNSATVPLALLERSFRFRTLALVEGSTRVVGWLGAIGFAAMGVGAASLVAGPLLTFGLMTVTLYTITRWRPHGFGKRSDYKALWTYGRGVTGYWFTDFFMHQSDSILVPLVTPTATVGLYNRAYNLMTLPVNQIGVPLARVMLPALAEVQDDMDRFRRGVRRSVVVVAAIGFPVAVGLGTTAPVLIPFLFGEAWTDSVFFVQVLSIASLVLIAELPLRSVFTATGQTGSLFRYGLVQCGLSVAAVVIGLFWGVHGVVIAIAVRQWLGVPISLGWPLRVVHQPFWEVGRALLGPLFAVIAMGAAVLAVESATTSMSDAVRLLLGVVTGGLLYPLFLRLFAPAAMAELVSFVKRLRHR